MERTMFEGVRSNTLLSAGDPGPVDLVNADGRSPVVLVCEHGGRQVPEALGDLGVGIADMDRHIACDIGAAAVARLLSRAMDAPLVLQRYSRLVVDCNRSLASPDCMPVISDGTAVPANENLSEDDRRQRYGEIHKPFHDAVHALLDRREGNRQDSMLLPIHSFTPQLRNGPPRPWLAGLLFNRDNRAAHLMQEALSRHKGEAVIGLNEPYRVDDASDYTIPVHGEGRGIPHVLLELRNDELGHENGQRSWASVVQQATEFVLRGLDLN